MITVNSDKWVLAIYPDGMYESTFNGAFFSVAEGVKYMEFESEAELLIYVADNGLHKQQEA